MFFLCIYLWLVCVLQRDNCLYFKNYGFYSHRDNKKAFVSSHATDKSCHWMLSGQFIQPSGSPATEVMNFSLPQYCLPWLPAVAHYLRQNLLIFLHVPKYTDSNTAHHFKVKARLTFVRTCNILCMWEKKSVCKNTHPPTQCTLCWHCHCKFSGFCNGKERKLQNLCAICSTAAKSLITWWFVVAGSCFSSSEKV